MSFYKHLKSPISNTIVNVFIFTYANFVFLIRFYGKNCAPLFLASNYIIDLGFMFVLNTLVFCTASSNVQYSPLLIDRQGFENFAEWN